MTDRLRTYDSTHRRRRAAPVLRLWGWAFAPLGFLDALIIFFGDPKHHLPGPRVFHTVRELPEFGGPLTPIGSRVPRGRRHYATGIGPKGSSPSARTQQARRCSSGNEVRRIAANIPKLPELLKRENPA